MRYLLPLMLLFTSGCFYESETICPPPGEACPGSGLCRSYNGFLLVPEGTTFACYDDIQLCFERGEVTNCFNNMLSTNICRTLENGHLFITSFYHCSTDLMPPGFRECTPEELSFASSPIIALSCADPECRATLGPADDPYCPSCPLGGSVCGDDGNIYVCSMEGEIGLIQELCSSEEGVECVEMGEQALCLPIEE